MTSLSKYIVTVSKSTHSYGADTNQSEKQSNDLQPYARGHIVNFIYFTIPQQWFNQIFWFGTTQALFKMHISL